MDSRAALAEALELRAVPVVVSADRVDAGIGHAPKIAAVSTHLE
jgi:hypothetical protein